MKRLFPVFVCLIVLLTGCNRTEHRSGFHALERRTGKAARLPKADRAAEQFYQNWAKEIGTNDAIKTLAEYHNVKYNDSPGYELLRRYVRSVESGGMLLMSHFDLYEEYYERIQNEIVGKTVGGIKITGQSKHLLERVFGTMVDPEKLKTNLQVIRCSGVSIDDMKDALFNPQEIAPVQSSAKNGFVRRSHRYTGKKCSVTLNPDTGVIIQTNPVGGIKNV